MDYKYIEQLLERYWACETTLEEEQILRAFFLQENLPSHLSAYRDIFALQDGQAQPHLSADFDRRMMELIGEEEKPAPPLSGCGTRGTAAHNRHGSTAQHGHR